MQVEVHTLSSNATVKDALYLMCLANVRHIAILEDGVYLGVVTQHDLLQMHAVQLTCRRSSAEFQTLAKRLTLGCLVRRNTPTLRPHDLADEASRLMFEHDCELIAVTTAAGQFCGLVTERDFLRWSRRAMRQLAPSA